MPRFYIHVRDGDFLYADEVGVEASSYEQVGTVIEEMVRDIIDDEGGPSVEEARLVEVTNGQGDVVIVIPFASAYTRH